MKIASLSKPLLRVRNVVCTFILPILCVTPLLVVAPACDSEERKVEEQDLSPIAITEELRAVGFHMGDATLIERVATNFTMDHVREEFPVAILRFQAYDEWAMINLEPEPYDFASRVLALREELEAHVSEPFVYDVHMDLQSLNRVQLSGPPPRGSTEPAPDTLHFRRRGSGDETPYLTYLREAVEEVAREIKPRRFVIGVAMNVYEEAQRDRDTLPDWEPFLSFYNGTLYPTIKEASPQTLVSIGLHWDSFIAQSNNMAQQIFDSGDSPDLNTARQEQDHILFNRLLELSIDQMDEIALEAHPGGSNLHALERDHYRRIIPLIPASMPVAFIRVWSPYAGNNDDSSSRQYLNRFRHLVGGINVSQIAWDRLIDVLEGGDQCLRIMANRQVPTNHRYCFSGLINTRAIRKDFWQEYLRLDIPSDPVAQ